MCEREKTRICGDKKVKREKSSSKMHKVRANRVEKGEKEESI
jgi:hypothetical protein